MLVNLTPKNTYRTDEERCVKYLNRYHKDDGISSKKWKVRKFSEVCIPTEYTGVFWCTGDHIVSYCKQHKVYGSKSYWNTLHRIPRNRLNVIRDYERNVWYYGVADNLEQIVDLYNKNEEGWFYGNHVILCCKVTKDPDSPCSGWRWHKWGPYIGTQNPQCEYLNDEPEIDEVIIFSIYKVI
jgi:hypothetical protein